MLTNQKNIIKNGIITIVKRNLNCFTSLRNKGFDNLLNSYYNRFRTKFLVLVLMVFVIGNYNIVHSQIFQSNPSNWIFPDGNSTATKYNPFKSNLQVIDSFAMKWETKAISGDVQPLIGNIINNPRLNNNFVFAPNEMIVVSGNEVKVVDARGGVYIQKSPNEFQFIKNVSVLLDTLQTGLNNDIRNPLVIGLETVEHKRDDSLAITYMLGFDNVLKTTKILKRFSINMREYPENVYASIKPIFGKLSGSKYLMYSTLNIANPKSTSQNPIVAPFMRGITQFDSENSLLAYPLVDVPDSFDNRITLGPEVNLSQPSISNMINNSLGVLLPSYPTTSLSNVTIPNPKVFSTITSKPYMFGFNINGNIIDEQLSPRDMTDFVNGTRPQIRSYYIDLQNSDLPVEPYILVAEEYKGIEGSVGRSRLHLFDKDGIPLTFPNDILNSPIIGSQNHFWSVAVGNVDGNVSNELLPFYPNNRGKEIIVTQTSKDFVFPSSKIMVLRYNSDDVPKPPPFDNLYAFDTLVTQRINGWVAAVNDLDGAPDNKDEIILVDGSKLMIIRMRDYQNVEFRLGRRFDTVYVKDFGTETITSVSVADIEGDSKNDIIVTTFSSTYIIGIPLDNLIQIQSPVAAESPDNYCIGDTLKVNWNNLLLAIGDVNVKFQTLRDSSYLDVNSVKIDTLLIDSLYTIENNVANDKDNVTYNLFVDTLLMGKKGYIIIESKNSPQTIFDTTKVIKFNDLAVQKTPFTNIAYKVGEEITFAGYLECADSIRIEYMNEGKMWDSLITENIRPSLPNYSITTQLPCLKIFSCSSKDIDSVILVRLISKVGGIEYVNSIDTLRLLPSDFPIVLDTNTTADPSVKISWDINKIEYLCDTITISYSIDMGQTFNFIDEVESKLESYKWNVPISIQDSIIIRLCCNNSCVRTDTLIAGLKVNYLDIVAPNPFNPYTSELEIVYKVPKDDLVTIKIYDSNNRLVKQVINSQSRLKGIAYTELWNGYNEDNIMANVGTYYIVLEFSNNYREIYPVFLRK